ncbi:hypothetical protein AVEN_238237-1 [Araneus ventricosus]|uniref:Uncharacterized protein n=1 Tax=Araneus ventricosus TaxID=182803 RepID=A0A4Y2VEH3_ARAVE|nr:hypothetical protein AVEN_238237-1 [Araneus ventricosus]
MDAVGLQEIHPGLQQDVICFTEGTFSGVGTYASSSEQDQDYKWDCQTPISRTAEEVVACIAQHDGDCSPRPTYSQHKATCSEWPVATL